MLNQIWWPNSDCSFKKENLTSFVIVKGNVLKQWCRVLGGTTVIPISWETNHLFTNLFFDLICLMYIIVLFCNSIEFICVYLIQLFILAVCLCTRYYTHVTSLCVYYILYTCHQFVCVLDTIHMSLVCLCTRYYTHVTSLFVYYILYTCH